MMNLQLQVGKLYSHSKNGSSSSVREGIALGNDGERRALGEGEIFLVVSADSPNRIGLTVLGILLGDKCYSILYEDMSFTRWIEVK